MNKSKKTTKIDRNEITNEITKSKFFFTIFLFNDIIKYFQKKLIPYVTLKNHIIKSAYLYGK